MDPKAGLHKQTDVKYFLYCLFHTATQLRRPTVAATRQNGRLTAVPAASTIDIDTDKETAGAAKGRPG